MLLSMFFVATLLQQQGPEVRRDTGRGLIRHEEGALSGYTLFAPLKSTTTYLVDMTGEFVHEWPSEYVPGCSVYLLEDGSLLRTCKQANEVFHGGGAGGLVQRVDWDGEVSWSLDFSTEDYLQHHDIEPLPNGNLLILAWEHRTAEEAIAAGRDPQQVGESFWPDWVIEVKPESSDGFERVWEWHAWDHLIQDFAPGESNWGEVAAHPERIDINGEHRAEPPFSAADRALLEELQEEMQALGYLGGEEEEPAEIQGAAVDPWDGRERRAPGDWLHSNSIDYLPSQDLIVLSVRNFDELWVIDHSTTTEEASGTEGGRFGHGGDLLYRWGNPRRYGAGDEADRQLFAQHDGRWLVQEDGSLALTVFDNGRGRKGQSWSRVLEIRLPFDPVRGFLREEGQAFGPVREAWSFGSPGKDGFFASFLSGAERLANGNTLVTDGPKGRVLEVTREGGIVWEFECSFEAASSARRAERLRRGARETPFLPPGPRDLPPREGPDRPETARAQGLFRATRISPDYPGLTRLAEED